MMIFSKYLMKSQRGVGLIEVLIAITIASFALLGLAALQVAGLKYQKVAHYRSLASQYSADLADHMRANTPGAASYITLDTYPAVTAAASTCQTASCTPINVAALDLYNWRSALAQATSGGWGEVAASTSVTGAYVVTVYFNEPGNGSGGTSDPKCRATAFASGFTSTTIRCFQTTFIP